MTVMERWQEEESVTWIRKVAEAEECSGGHIARSIVLVCFTGSFFNTILQVT